MKKIATLLIASAFSALAGDYTLDNTASEVYYEAKKEQFWSTHIILAKNSAIEGTLTESAGALGGKLIIDVMKFDSDNSMRDSNVEEHLNAEKYPNITYDYNLKNNQASGMMMVNGVRKEISFPVRMKEEGDTLYVEGNISIKYSDFGLETPSNLILSAHEDLVIGAKLHFKR